MEYACWQRGTLFQCVWNVTSTYICLASILGSRARDILLAILPPHSLVGKSSACNAGDPGSIPGSGRCPGKGNGNPLQYSCLENPIDRGAWQATVHRTARVGHDLGTKPPPPHTSTSEFRHSGFRLFSRGVQTLGLHPQTEGRRRNLRVNP